MEQKRKVLRVKGKDVIKSILHILSPSPITLSPTKGFTLVELLVVISVIGILASIFIGVYSSAQKQARDGQRKFDIKNIQAALEQYYSQKNPQHYPKAAVYDDGTALDATSLLQAEGLLKIPPDDPIPAQSYYYKAVKSDGTTACDDVNGIDCQDYILCAKLENANDKDHVDNNVNYTCTGQQSSAYNYGVHAP